MELTAFRRFVLERGTDPTGISGTGIVAAGVVWPSGKVTFEWRAPDCSLTTHMDLAAVTRIHCHNGATVIRWLDPPAVTWRALHAGETAAP